MVTETRQDGQIYLKCLGCGAAGSYPDKGLGRAAAAAWKTRHQHG